MEREDKLVIFKAFSLLFIGLLGLFGFAYMHEMVHLTIYETYGLEAEVDMFNFPHATTTANGTCPNAECNLAHNINEAISYPLMIIFVYFILANSIKELK